MIMRVAAVEAKLSEKRLRRMKFTKMHGCGNDYVCVNGFEETVPDLPAAARLVSDRHFGVGADGLILILPSDSADFRMQIFNPDGSEAEMCGNGIRGVGKYVFDRGLTDKTELEVETKAGAKKLGLTVTNGNAHTVRVNMGEPRLKRSDIPMKSHADSPGRVLRQKLHAGGKVFEISCVSMGNPHTVVRVGDVSGYPVREHGPLIENHPLFPERTNVEFVQVISPNELRSRTWERGAGETLACGTGASAAVVACALNGWADRKVLTHLVGGDLEIEWAADNCVYMTGPAVEVFTGEIELGGAA